MERTKENIQKMFADLCPEAVRKIDVLLHDDATPIAAQVQLIGMILDRTMGKAETPIKVTNVQENIEAAQEELMAIVCEIQEEMRIEEAEEQLRLEEKNESADD